MADSSNLFGPMRSLAQGAIAMLVEGEGFWDIYRTLRERPSRPRPAAVRGAISLARSALSAVTPLGSQNRYRIRDIPVIGPTFTEVPQLSSNMRFSARGIATWTDAQTGNLEFSTVFSRYNTLPNRSTIERDLRRQAEYQQRNPNYPGRKERAPPGTDLSISFVALTRAL